MAGEVLGALREQLAGSEQRIAAERDRADRGESRAAHEHEDLLDAESRAQRAEEGRAAEHERVEQLRQAVARTEAARRNGRRRCSRPRGRAAGPGHLGAA